MRYFAGDIIKAAKDNKKLDRLNAKEIAEYHNISLAIVKEEIIFVRKNIAIIDPEWVTNQVKGV